MTSKAELSGSTDQMQRSAEEERDPSLHSALEQEIRRRAYELYVERGGEPGRDIEDWLQAERELTADDSNAAGA